MKNLTAEIAKPWARNPSKEKSVRLDLSELALLRLFQGGEDAGDCAKRDPRLSLAEQVAIQALNHAENLIRILSTHTGADSEGLHNEILRGNAFFYACEQLAVAQEVVRAIAVAETRESEVAG